MQKNFVPDQPWSRISLDLVGPLNSTVNGNRYLLTCVDFLTRFPECIALPDIKAETVARAFFENIILRYGVPRELLTDCGSQFVSNLFTEICRLLEISKLKTTPYHPSANGIIERMHKTLKTMISHFISNYNNSWDEILPFALMAYRNSVHEATHETPFFLMFGRDMELPFHLCFREDRVKYDVSENYVSEMIARMQQAHAKAKICIEKNMDMRLQKQQRKRLKSELNVGDHVYVNLPAVPGKNVATKFKPKWDGPYRIIEKKGLLLIKLNR